MKSAYARRYRRSSSSTREAALRKKDPQPEPAFFHAPGTQSFFKPAPIYRKCAHCEGEEKGATRLNASPQEEKKIRKTAADNELHSTTDKKEKDTGHRKEAVEKDAHAERTASHNEEEKLQRMEDKKEDKEVHRMQQHQEEDKAVSKKDAGSVAPASSAAAFIHSLDGKGSSLPGSAADFFGERMDHDFSHVKIHTGHDAEQSARQVNAKAYAVGNHIVFNRGEYNPESAGGKKLLAHELTHVMQSDGAEVKRRTLDPEKDREDTVTLSGTATRATSKKAFGHCEGVEVHGQTDFTPQPSGFSVQARTRPSIDCDECSAPDCIVSSGTIVSTFRSAITVTLPPVPDGLSDCETAAVRRFINTTLRNHEQQHVAAFSKYNGTVRTPFTYTGCKSGLQAFVQSIHDGIDARRSASANAASDALDPFVRSIPCNCD